MSADLIAVLDAAGLERVHFLGHSTGAAIGTATALNRPSRIASLMIYASTTCGDAYRHRVLGLRRTLAACVGMDAYARYTTLLLYPPYWINANDARLATEEIAAAASLGNAAVQGSRLNAIRAFECRAEYGRLDLPVHTLCTEDVMSGRIGSRRAKIEPRQRGSWNAWVGVSLVQRPDDALHGDLGHTPGVSAEAVGMLCDAALEHIAGDGHGTQH